MYECVCTILLAATFFCTYEMTKVLLKSHSSSSIATPFIFMVAATVGEVVSTMINCRKTLFTVNVLGDSSCEGAF